jgi:NAD(P)-dependent dehydrogenase (short-subunit alcohol dehydrogenase family)
MATVLITGANRGIGLELARQYLQRGDKVIAACRKASPALQRLDVRMEEGVDVASDESVASLAERLGDTRLDILINNAGVLRRTALQPMDFDEIRRTFEVNTLGPLRVTVALLDNLAEGARVGMVTSRMGSIADNTSGSHYAYRISKAALNMAAASLAQDLRDRGVSVVLLHPGFVRTEMTGGNGYINADESAAGLIARIDETSLENSGRFTHQDGTELPW